MLIFDAHLDLSWNAMDFNRDLRWTQERIRRREHRIRRVDGDRIVHRGGDVDQAVAEGGIAGGLLTVHSGQ